MRNAGILFVMLYLGLSAALAQQEGQAPPSSPRRNVPTTHLIRGRVYLPSGFPVQDQMRVTLRTITQAVVHETFTDSVGNFEFRNLSSGNYEVIVAGDDHEIEPAVERIEIFGRVSRTFFANIFLKAKPEAPEQKPKSGVVSFGQLDPNIPKSARKEYEQAVQDANKGHYDKAIAHFQRAIGLYPKYFEALNDLGVQYFRLKRFTEAEDVLTKASSIDPLAPFPHLNLGYMRLAQKQFPEAVRALARVVELDAMNWAGHLWLGVALMETQEYDSSKSELEKALSLGQPPEVSNAHLYLANLYIRQGDLARAIEQSEQYLKEVPKDDNAEEIRQKIAKMRSAIEQGQRLPGAP
ncbi:MAG: tetratricopeptide repeat protein [Acidobacteria bacterium]|nr:tetratricopeptide repeat protein [Acidobacteriota bacterium]